MAVLDVLLGSLSSFERMAGKFIGTIALGMTLHASLLIAAIVAAASYGWLSAVTVTTVVLAMFGAIFLAAGATAIASTDVQSRLSLATSVPTLALAFVAMRSAMNSSFDTASWLVMVIFPLMAPFCILTQGEPLRLRESNRVLPSTT